MQACEPVMDQRVSENGESADAAEAEVARVMQICNACRYCEGFCAVFPAMTRRIEFGKADAHYLANLCHNCGSCLHACQYAPPHEFVVNVPQAMARLRGKTYADYAWPACMGTAYRHAGRSLLLALLASLVLFFLVPAGNLFERVDPPGNFFALFPHGALVWLFGVVFALAALALGVGVSRFWHDVSPGVPNAASATEATHAILTLKYLDGGHGEGCNNEDDAFSLWRRNFHHLTFYGFLLCFAATLAATFYHYVLGIHAPYALTSLPVVLGTVGGIGLVIGPAGQLWCNLCRHPLHGDTAQRPLDRGFMLLLLLTSASGLALLAWRDTVSMGVLLVVHLGAVMAFFLTLPYGKFAHGIYRSAALLKWTIEKRQASRLKLGGD
ncbi:MAG: tricarballylate utilization 4Fe-4S protein TcuB [Propionivibrio sp.]|nr:tricarballylate utilization 4Fe-4S protein TcuB [Propionivibrio sp.]